MLTASASQHAVAPTIGNSSSDDSDHLVTWNARRSANLTIRGASSLRSAAMELGLRCAVGVAVASMAGCRTPSSRENTRPEGRSSFEILPAPDFRAVPAASPEPPQQSAVRVVYIPPRPRRSLRKPEYPATALAAHFGQHIVYVTCTIDVSGRVTDVHPSWMRPAMPTLYADEFLAAVRAALSQWEMEPARHVYWQRRPSGEDQYLRAEPVSEKVEVKFTFEASGVVR